MKHHEKKLLDKSMEYLILYLLEVDRWLLSELIETEEILELMIELNQELREQGERE